MGHSIAEINQMPQAVFVTTLGAIFENTPTIAEQTWYHRPFVDITDLHQQMIKTMNALSTTAQLVLIQAHPDLGSKVKMAAASVQEQASAGLDHLTPEEFAQFQSLNQQYRDRFGFPFIIAVKNHTKTSILATFVQRLAHAKDVEMQRALTEIAEIARFRLLALVE